MTSGRETLAGVYTCVTEEETLALGRQIASTLLPGAIVCIKGELGAGKTVLCRGIAAGLGVEPNDVRSPTFSIVHEYRGRVETLHLDCYRLEKTEEALQIGWEDYLARDAVMLIEWPERITELLPAGCLEIRMETVSDGRRITVMKAEKS